MNVLQNKYLPSIRDFATKTDLNINFQKPQTMNNLDMEEDNEFSDEEGNEKVK